MRIQDTLESRGTDEDSDARAAMRDRYLALLRRALTQYEMETGTRYTPLHPMFTRPIAKLTLDLLRRRSLDVVRIRPPDPHRRHEGKDWPENAETMVGIVRLDNLRECLEQVFRDEVPGDVLEAGVWRGGASILMRGVIIAYDQGHRESWVADSFMGLPAPDPGRYPADQGWRFHTQDELAVSRDRVVANFAKYDLLDDHVHFLEGWFEDTLPTAPVRQLALLRLDGDLYALTMQTLVALYDKVSPGGFVVVDDYNGVLPCKQATDEFRSQEGVTEPIVAINWTGAYWRKTG